MTCVKQSQACNSVLLRGPEGSRVTRPGGGEFGECGTHTHRALTLPWPQGSLGPPGHSWASQRRPSHTVRFSVLSEEAKNESKA